jgi:FixJ family two-component response regulator
MIQSPTVFIVDDDAALRASLTWLLTAAAFTTRPFAAADDFLAAVTPADAGCLLIDLHHPGLAGAALLDNLAARRIALPVIIVTGDLAADAVVALRPRLFDALPKPCSEPQLLDRIRAALAHDHATRTAHRP